MSLSHVLFVEAGEGLTRMIPGGSGYHFVKASDAAGALETLKQQQMDLVVLDMDLPGTMPASELLRRIRIEYPQVAVIVVTAASSMELGVEALTVGAYNYLTKPVDPVQMRALMYRALGRPQVQGIRIQEGAAVRNDGFERIIGNCNALIHVRDLASRVAQNDVSVLITGEPGTGKELVARTIHFNSPRRERPFVTVHCGSIPKGALEGELFGYLRGAFFGASADKIGKVEMANGGTLYLDEIGEVPLNLQTRLLHLIQAREMEKAGGSAPVKVDIRVIAGTNHSLDALVNAGKFRRDLYYKLAVISIELPPLRDRDGDIAILAQHFFERSKLKYQKNKLNLPPSAISGLLQYDWPGNIRELENLIERIVLLSRTDEVSLSDLPDYLNPEHAASKHPQVLPSMEGVGLEEMEREMIVRALHRFHWNQTQAANHLAITRKTLRYRMAKYGIQRPVEPPQQRLA